DSAFEIPFHDYRATDHLDMIEDVPFLKTRSFLKNWFHKIEGPLHTVVVGHTKARVPSMIL
ncbi:MAG: hypothetical protein COB76_00340, partial [Alphaproteobacteria bacterium]